MTSLFIDGGRPLAGQVTAPPDKSITHRALFLAALAKGSSTIAPLGGGRDNRATLEALRSLGVEIELSRETANVEGVGSPRGLRASGPIDCSNSGTTMRVLAGILASSGTRTTLFGDDSLMARPMSRLAPLVEMGAKIQGRFEGEKIYPPLLVEGRALLGRAHRLVIASAQVKTALIFAGLWAKGPSTIHEPHRSRDHTERMLRALGVELPELEDTTIVVEPLEKSWAGSHFEVPPDLSSAAFFLGAALVTKSDLSIVTGVNPTRSGVLEVLAKNLLRRELPSRGGEPVAELRVQGTLAPFQLAGAHTLRAIDEVPLLAALAAFAPGTTIISGAEELRVKESDRLSATRAMLQAFGAAVEERPDGLVIEGGRPLHPAVVDGQGDHRIAMSAAVMALGIPGETEIRGAEHIEVSFPNFADNLTHLGASVRMR
jgi:3-phosphoshikimate 1-carboxyvinyltransferase